MSEQKSEKLDKQCATCAFWKPNQSERYGGDPYGTCRRRSPQLMLPPGEPYSDDPWVVVYSDDFCGEWMAYDDFWYPPKLPHGFVPWQVATTEIGKRIEQVMLGKTKERHDADAQDQKE